MVALPLLTHTLLIKNNPQPVTTVNAFEQLNTFLPNALYTNKLERKIIYTSSSHILINAPKRYIFNLLNEINIFNKL